MIGSGTNIISMSEQLRAGEITLEEFHEAEAAMNRSPGHCMTMGTASTMACMVEALGVGLPENAAIPAVDARRNLLARMAGRRIVEMVHEDLVLSQDPDARGVRERDPRIGARSAAPPTPSCICSRSRGRVGDRTDARRLGPARPRRAIASST